MLSDDDDDDDDDDTEADDHVEQILFFVDGDDNWDGSNCHVECRVVSLRTNQVRIESANPNNNFCYNFCYKTDTRLVSDHNPKLSSLRPKP